MRDPSWRIGIWDTACNPWRRSGEKERINESINQSTENQSINQSTKHPINQSINQQINQSINQPNYQSINQPINQSINQPIDLLILTNQANFTSPNFPIDPSTLAAVGSAMRLASMIFLNFVIWVKKGTALWAAITEKILSTAPV